jgi:hypothetical protein
MIVLDETFIDNRNEWWEEDNTEARARVEGGSLLLESRKAGWSIFKNLGLHAADEIKISAELRRVSGATDTGLGFLWGQSDNKNYYTFCISGNGYYRIAEMKKGVNRPIRDWLRAQSVNAGNLLNKLTLVLAGGYGEFYVNDALVERIPIQEKSGGGSVGLIVYGLMTIRVHHFLVERLNGQDIGSRELSGNPIFGPPSFRFDRRLAFVLMPFNNELTNLYRSVLKPTIEAAGLVCRRADDLKSNHTVMQDVWRGICEARMIIADLTGLNPNVLYELGIAHTVGKETILLCQKSQGEFMFPLDLAHIRRIDYDASDAGQRKLVLDLLETLKAVCPSL